VSGGRARQSGGVAVVLCALLTALAVCASAATGAVSRADNFDAHWLRVGAQADVFSIASGRIVVVAAVDPRVREAAQLLVTGATESLAARQVVARRLRVPLPRRADPVQTVQINQLAAAAADPAVLEPLFARIQVAALQLEILHAAEAAKAGTDPAVRRLARSAVIDLKRQHQLFRSLQF
jgi:Domain of unknown function (DUF4142)